MNSLFQRGGGGLVELVEVSVSITSLGKKTRKTPDFKETGSSQVQSL
jgi:hypothetical protein